MKLNLQPKLVKKLVWVFLILFCKIFIHIEVFDALLCRNWPFSAPNRLTLGLNQTGRVLLILAPCNQPIQVSSWVAMGVKI